MQQKDSAEMEKISSGEKQAAKMNQAIEMQSLIKSIGSPLFADEQRIFRIERAARKLGITARTAKAYWYGERLNIPASDMDRARDIAQTPVVKEATNELAALRQRIARLETALAVQDEDFSSPFRDALRQSIGSENRTLD
jgi:hypothetical protein